MNLRLVVLSLCCLLLAGCAAAQHDIGPIVDPAPPLPAAYLVLFAPDSVELDEPAKHALDGLLRDYKVYRPPVLYVDGYYDRSATEQHADLMSKRMAEAVRDYLVTHGVPPSAIELAWHGESHPLVSTDDGVAEAANRSVDVRFTAMPNPGRL